MQYYRIEGRKPVTFVVEMGLCACAEEWNSLTKSLMEKGGVLLYERAGTGRSGSSGAERSPENIAGELHELMNHIEHEPKIILLAHSQGGLYAQQYIRMYPEEVRGVIFIDPLSAGDYVFKEQLSEKEYVKSGVDKSRNLLILEKMAKFRLGWLSRKMMKNAPPFYYAEFSEQETEAILNSYTDRGHLRTCYQEYLLAHDKELVKDLREKGNFPDIPLTLITHSSDFAIEENMKFGNNTHEFAVKIEEMWQNLMMEYLHFSSKSRYVQANHSGHYIHLTEPELILREVDRML